MTEYRAEPVKDGSSWRVVDADGHVVAWACSREDARQFAAAQEMYEALKKVRIISAVALWSEHANRIDHALAKAEGRDD